MADFSLLVGTKVDTSDIQAQLDKMSKKATVTTKVKFDGADAIKDVTTYTDKLGNMATVTKITTTSGEQLSNSISKVKTTTNDASTSLDKASKSAKDVGDNFNHSSREGKNLASQFVDITKKVLAFGAVTQVIMLFRQGISEAVTSVREMDSALIELRKVSDLSGESLKNYTKDAFDLAEQLHTTASSVTEAVTEFSKSGYDVEQSKALAEQAIIFQTIADGEIKASEAATTLIQVMKAYNMTVEKSTHVVNALNEVSNQYAVSSTDLNINK